MFCEGKSRLIIMNNCPSIFCIAITVYSEYFCYCSQNTHTYRHTYSRIYLLCNCAHNYSHLPKINTLYVQRIWCFSPPQGLVFIFHTGILLPTSRASYLFSIPGILPPTPASRSPSLFSLIFKIYFRKKLNKE